MVTLPQSAQQVITILKQAGFEAYAIGGSVRDTLMDRPAKGWDYTTNAEPDQILQLFPDSFYDNTFGTVGIKIYKQPTIDPDNPEIEDIYEITTYRSEQGYTDRRHPDVINWGHTLAEDVGRRDFTINAIAMDGSEIIDLVGGHDDIKNKLVRAIGNPHERFDEDALRMMRAIRIASQLGFMIEQNTQQAIQANAHKLEKISSERIRDELLKLLQSPFASDGILILKNCGLLTYILPELEKAFETPQKSPKRHHMHDVGTHLILSLKYCPSNDPIVKLATLLHDIGKPITFRKDPEGVITFYNHEVVGTKIATLIAHRLRLSKKQIEKITMLVRWHQFSVDERQTDSAIRRIIRKVGKENLADMLALRIGDRLGGGARETSWRLELFKKRLEEVQKQPFTVADLVVNGYDVMIEFGIKPGPVVGKVLDQLFSEVEEGKLLNDREILMTRIKQLKEINNLNSTMQ